MKYLILPCLFFLLAATLQAQCINGNCETGIGMFKTPNGGIYEGQFKGGLPHGNGRLVKVSGDVYEGQFKYGFFDGLGTLFGADSTVYRGAFRQGVKQGKGELTYANGKKVTGMFRNDQSENEKDDLAEKLNFFSCDLNHYRKLSDNDGNRVLTAFDFPANKVYIDTLVFDLTTGRLLSNEKPPKVLVKDKLYTLIPQHSYAYYQMLPKNFGLITPKLPHINKDHLIISGWNRKDNKQNFLVYKMEIPSGNIEKLSTFKNVSYIDEYRVDHTVSSDGKLLFHALSGEIYTDGGKKKVVISDFVPNQLTPFNWFSAAGDTLYRLGNDLSIRCYDASNGKLIKRNTYANNRLLLNDEKYRKIVAFSPEQARLIVMFDTYKADQWLGLGEHNFRKAAVLDLHDPDYLMPLVNPFYVESFYVEKAKAARKEWNDQAAYEQAQIAEARKKYGGAKPASSKITSILDDENDNAYKKPSTVKKGSSSAGVCIWCGGSGKVTSKDVYDKGYNTTYTSNGSRASLRSVGGSTTTSVCMACHGTGH